MPLIAETGRRDLRVRLLREGIFVALVAGALTTLAPFLLLMAGSVRGGVDQRESGFIPHYLTNHDALWRKHVEALFDERLDAARAAYDEDFVSMERLQPPSEPKDREVEAWRAFLSERKPEAHYFALGHLYAPVTRVQPMHLRGFKAALAERYPDIEQLNNALDVDFASWTSFVMPPDDLLPRRTRPGRTPLDIAYRHYKEQQSELWRVYYVAEGYFRSTYLKARYGRDIAAYNLAHGTSYQSYAGVPLPDRAPDGPPRARADWEDFVRRSLNLLWIRLDPTATPDWQSFLRARYVELDALNRRHGMAYASFDAIEVPVAIPAAGAVLPDWEVFITGWTDPSDQRWHGAPLGSIRVRDIAFEYRDWLKRRHGDLETAAAVLGVKADDWLSIRPPQKEQHDRAVREHASLLRREFLGRNYATVLDYLVHNGRGLINTVIYCTAAVLSALLVNPLAAYALSRYRPASTYRILLFLLLTMAFPPMVTQIPAFLLLRDLNLLNSFWALILPGLANGYSIFLLKGFFDSLPRELFEQAQIDGAGEWTLFWRITMSLSKPILAVVALHAFTAAYANFMFALLICQDPRMWTLMVWLYQLQQRSGPGVIYASLVLAAIPTLLIFLFCQKIILRGIVIPVEK